MAPVRRDLRQGAHDEEPLVGAGVRQDKVRVVDHLTTMGDQVEIQCPGRVAGAARPAHPLLDGEKRGEQGMGVAPRLDKHDAVAIFRGFRIGPGGGPPPARPGQHGQSGLGEPRQSRLKQRLAGGETPGQVAADGDDDRCIEPRCVPRRPLSGL